MTNQKQSRDSFIFYRSFYDASRCLKTNEKAQLFDAICSYALDEKIEQLDGTAFGMFQLVKPQLDANRKRYINGLKGAEHGSKGGRPIENNPKKTPNLTPKKPQDNPKITPNENDNVNVNDNENVNQECKLESINHNHNSKTEANLDFQEFWDHYTPVECNGRVVGKDSKKTAEEKYRKVRTQHNHDVIMLKLKQYLTYCKKNSILTKAVHRWLTTTDFSDTEQEQAIIADRPFAIASKQDIQQQQNHQAFANFLSKQKD